MRVPLKRDVRTPRARARRSCDKLRRRAGGGGYDLLADPDLLEWWNPRVGLVAGAVASWLGVLRGFNLQQPVAAARPVWANNAIVGPTSTFPGLTFTTDGLQCTDAAYQAAVDVESAIEGFAIVQKLALGVGVVMEHGTGAQNGFALLVDDTVNNTIEPLGRGGGGLGAWRSNAGTAPFADPNLASVQWQNPGTGNTGSVTRRIDNVELPGANVLVACAAGTYDATSFNVGGRNGGASLNFAGVIGDVLLFRGVGSEAMTRLRAQSIAAFYGGDIVIA